MYFETKPFNSCSWSSSSLCYKECALLAKDLATKSAMVSWFNFNGYWLFSPEPHLKERQPEKLSLLQEKTESGKVYINLWWSKERKTKPEPQLCLISKAVPIKALRFAHLSLDFRYLLKAILSRTRADFHLIILNRKNVKTTIVSFLSMFDIAAITTSAYNKDIFIPPSVY